MRRVNPTAVVLLAAIATAGCATITRGTIEALVIETDPAGSTALLSNGMQCMTPCVLLVKRRGEIVVTVEKPGYETVEATVTSSVRSGGAMGVAANYYLGPIGIIGAVVDSRGGAALSRQPSPLVVRMEPLARAKGSAADPARPAPDECAAKIGRCADSAVREADPEPDGPVEEDRA